MRNHQVSLCYKIVFDVVFSEVTDGNLQELALSSLNICAIAL